MKQVKVGLGTTKPRGNVGNVRALFPPKNRATTRPSSEPASACIRLKFSARRSDSWRPREVRQSAVPSQARLFSKRAQSCPSEERRGKTGREGKIELMRSGESPLLFPVTQ